VIAPALCNKHSCHSPAISGELTCFEHLSNPSSYQKRASHLIQGSSNPNYLDLSKVHLQSLRLTNRKFIGTRLVGATLDRVVFEHCHLSLVFLHDAFLFDCQFEECRLSAVILAGSELRGCRFNNCDIQRCNFIGATLTGTQFESCDLTSSRFINGTLRKVTMSDCNLHHAHLELANISDLSTPMSNLEDAHRQ